MKFKYPLDTILGQRSKIKILRLLSFEQDQLTIREISRRINLTVPNISRALKELEIEGIVISQQMGKSTPYSLNKKHYLVNSVVLPIFKKEMNVKKELVKLLKRKLSQPIESFILFGSLARKQEKAISDIDMLFVIIDKLDKKLIEKEILNLNADIVYRFGNSISPIVMTISEFLTKIKKKDSLLSEILKEGEVLDGKIISQLLSYA